MENKTKMFIITEWGLDSCGRSYAQVRLFTDYDKATAAYGERWNEKYCPCGSKRESYSTQSTVTNSCECGQDYVSTTTRTSGPMELADYETGTWKRPSGKQLRIIGVDGERYCIQVWPDEHSYYE